MYSSMGMDILIGRHIRIAVKLRVFPSSALNVNKLKHVVRIIES